MEHARTNPDWKIFDSRDIRGPEYFIQVPFISVVILGYPRAVNL
jgi:hypothetical protein